MRLKLGKGIASNKAEHRMQQKQNGNIVDCGREREALGGLRPKLVRCVGEILMKMHCCGCATVQ